MGAYGLLAIFFVVASNSSEFAIEDLRAPVEPCWLHVSKARAASGEPDRSLAGHAIPACAVDGVGANCMWYGKVRVDAAGSASRHPRSVDTSSYAAVAGVADRPLELDRTDLADSGVLPPSAKPVDRHRSIFACDQGREPLSIVVTAGQRGDSPQFTAVLDGISVPRPGPGRPRNGPDKTYGSAANRAHLAHEQDPRDHPDQG